MASKIGGREGGLSQEEERKLLPPRVLGLKRGPSGERHYGEEGRRVLTWEDEVLNSNSDLLSLRKSRGKMDSE